MIRLIKGDCLKKMRMVDDGSVDLILCDLPYGTTACKWDTVIPFEPLWAHYKRIIKPRGAIVLTASQPFTSALVMSNPRWFRHEWMWKKNCATGHLNATRRPMLNHEQILVFSDSGPNYFPQGVRHTSKTNRRGAGLENYGAHRLENLATGENYPRTILEFGVHRSIGQHPTQKPVALMEYLIRTYTHEGETVLDNTMGSGTTGVACVNTGRNFIGIELDEKYFQTAADRIAKAERKRKYSLFHRD
jgi:DNA modification methylase